MKYDTIRTFGESKRNWLIAFLWGLAEGTVFFIVPDAYLAYIALFTVTGGLFGILWSVIGALVSGALFFAIVPGHISAFQNFLLRIPGIGSSMIQTVSQSLHEHGVRGLIEGPLSGIPYKIYTIEAAADHLSLPSYLLWSIVARLERILPVTVLGIILGVLFRKKIQRRPGTWTIAYIGIWIIIYVLYFTRVPS